MKRPKVKFGLYLIFVFAAILCFFASSVVTLSIFETGSIKDTIALGFFLTGACFFVKFAFECKEMEFSLDKDKNLNLNPS